MNQLPAMQGEVSRPRPSDRAGKPSRQVPAPLGAGPRCPRRYPQAQDPAIRQVGTIYANYVKYATFGTPMGSLCPSLIGRWAPSNSWSQAACHGPHFLSLAYHPLPTQHGACFSLTPSKSNMWASLLFAVSPPRSTLFLPRVHSSLWPSTHIRQHMFLCSPPNLPQTMLPRHTNMSLSFPQTCRKSLTLTLTHNDTHMETLAQEPLSLPGASAADASGLSLQDDVH